MEDEEGCTSTDGVVQDEGVVRGMDVVSLAMVSAPVVQALAQEVPYSFNFKMNKSFYM